MKRSRFKKAVNTYKNVIYSQAFYFTGNREDAEDITQEVLLRLWNHLENINMSSIKAWLMKVTKNICIDLSKKKKRILTDSFDNNEELSLCEIIPDDAPGPEKQLINKDLKERITGLINKLPENIRSIVIMRDIQRLKYAEIAEVAEISINSVKVNLHRGRKLLLKDLYKTYNREFSME